MTVENLRESGCIIFEAISGSKAYGLSTENSDTDIRGVYVLPQNLYYGLSYIDQINDNNNNVVFYEIGKVVELLLKNNPSMMELLGIPNDCVLYKHPVYDKLKASTFLSKLSRDSFAGYAFAQIKKSKGLNKKIVNPVDKDRKSVLDFCYISVGNGSKPLSNWLLENQLQQENCGLSKIPHFRDCYNLYYSKEKLYAGIVHSSENSNDVCVSSIDRSAEPLAILSFNKDGYSQYCKDYADYWNWVSLRNEERYKETLSNEKNYDAKNMMHVFRLLDMASEIALGELLVKRPNREELLEIKSGKFEYEFLLESARKKLDNIHKLYANSHLPNSPNVEIVESILVDIRTIFYNEQASHRR